MLIVGSLRNFELVRLQRKHIVFNLQSPAPAYEGHFEIHLNNRKGWQAKIDKKNKEGDLQGTQDIAVEGSRARLIPAFAQVTSFRSISKATSQALIHTSCCPVGYIY